MTRAELRERIARDLARELDEPGDPRTGYEAQADYVISLMEQVREACAAQIEEARAIEMGPHVVANLARRVHSMTLPEPKP